MKICPVPSLFLFITRMLLFFFYCILFVSPFVFSTAHLSDRRRLHLGNASDQEALFGFMSAITYDPSESLGTTWKPNVSFCEWTGIMCSRRRQRVVSINVSSMGLEGTISPLLSNLSFLRILDLSNNTFHGFIPYQLGNLFRLKKLHLFLNQLEGFIPSTLSGCRSLRNLTLHHNNLGGNIPTELCVLPYLQRFHLASNNLMGTIPACLGNISSLNSIFLSDNLLTGTIPACLGNIPSLNSIVLTNNSLTGQIPSSLSNCTNLLVIAISENQLTGHVPVELCNGNQLTQLIVERNRLSGSIPASLVNCTKLQILNLRDNQLGGVVPMELGKLTQLQRLLLGANQLVSTSNSFTSLPILTALANCSTLNKIDLSENHLTGHLPLVIGLFSITMDFIDLSKNELAGKIPSQIGNLTNLSFLDLDTNCFTGKIPSSLKMLQNLQRLYMGSNNLQGNIPSEIGQLKSLGLLAIQKNNLSGTIPDSIGHLEQLRYLYLSKNKLSGKIPANLGECVNLELLDLSYNRLSGDIPLQVGGLTNLAFYFNISNNLLEGYVSLELSKMSMVEAIDISANRLSGHIPSGLGDCKEVEYLNLSCNTLEGPIPMSLGELQSLQDMDFSINNLSGGIPISLANLKMLNHLNLSFNNLSGEVPKHGVFKKLDATAFMGNPRLHGPRVSIPPYFAHRHRSVSHLRRVIIFIVAVVVIVVSCLFLGTLWRKNHKRHISVKVGESLNVGHRRISYGELVTATEEFSYANLLGVGSFGKVYKGILNDGTIVAVKLLNLENERARKSFDKECKVFGKVRHRNLIRIITSYSDHQIKALIFPLMPNGSLENWLYPSGEVEIGLSLIQRLNIAIDIAQGMAYLHHHCFMQVIHCDLKPSNVLLGEDMTAYLIDFGIATVFFAEFEDLALTSTHALKGSAGYIPPEYGLSGCVTTKGDVYSYGVMLLEMLTGKKPTDNMFVEGMNLQKWVGSGFPDRVGEVVDSSLLRTSTITEEDKEHNCLSQLISVGLRCTKESPKGRPTMINIVGILQKIKETFLGVVGIPKFQSHITHLLGSTSTACNNIDEGPNSSTF